MDDSFRRPGTVPFDWEIEPGIPKPHRASSPTAMTLSKLTPPPRMAPALLSPPLLKSRSQSSPFYPPPPPPPPPSTATATTVFYRSMPASPSRLRALVAADPRKKCKAPSPPVRVIAVPGGCFPVPSSLKQKENRKSVVWTEEDAAPAALPRRSASSRTSVDSSSSSPFRSSVLERDETKIAAPWFF